MAAKSRTVIIREIEEHIAANGGAMAEWFVGVTDNPKKRLFSEHKLRESGDGWICRRALDDLQAREIEEYFRTVQKTTGWSKPTNADSVYVYAYKRKKHTSP